MIRRCFVVAVLACAMIGWAHAGSFSGRVHPTRAVVLRSSASLYSPAKAVIPAGTVLTVVGGDSSWCLVRYGAQQGFVSTQYLALDTTRTAIRSGRGYINRAGNWVPSPTRTADGSAPPGASAQCCDGTFSFSQSRSGTCSHHGGVCRWLR